MSEVAMWQFMRAKLVLPKLIHAERITERLSPGVPDVAYTREGGRSGWVELKFLPTVRHRPRIPWKSRDQPLWLSRWARGGGTSGVLLRMKRDVWVYWRTPKDVRWVTEAWDERIWDWPHTRLEPFDAEALVGLLTGR